MKIIEILSGLQVPITNEEADVMRKFSESEEVRKKDLDPREVILANSLVNKEILRRVSMNGKVTYTKNIRD